jgi:hypothetical protein
VIRRSQGRFGRRILVEEPTGEAVPNTQPIGHGAERAPTRRTWTHDEVRSLGTVTDIETAASILGIGRTKAYELARAKRFPVRIIPVGSRYKVPVAALLQLLEG